MKNNKDINDLIADESFINYCRNASEKDVAFWEKYISENPSVRPLIEQAREQFVLVFNAMAIADLDEQSQRLEERLSRKEKAPVIKLEDSKDFKPNRTISRLKIGGIAASLLTAGLFAGWYFTAPKVKESRSYSAAYGERKNIQLPDGSVVNMNAGSRIEIDADFGTASRKVKLEGEAFFDVKHNESLPFVVQTPAMDIKALGTAFDVKAYRDETITETSLIRGLVEITLKENSNRRVLLHPNQKIVWKHPGTAKEKTDLMISAAKSIDTDSHQPEKIRVTERGDIKEIAWKENKLVFEDDSFSDIAVLLQRWYGVQMNFSDEAIKNYRFTAAFEKEDLKTVLGLLKESRDFDFTIETGENVTVSISK